MSASILIVEDEWLIAEDYVFLLEQAGYRIVGPCPSVDTALAALQTEPVDAALLDMQLHGEMSFPVAQHLQQRNIPFAFLSGHGRRDIPSEIAPCDLVAKPVTKLALLAVAKKLCPNG